MKGLFFRQNGPCDYLLALYLCIHSEDYCPTFQQLMPSQIHREKASRILYKFVQDYIRTPWGTSTKNLQKDSSNSSPINLSMNFFQEDNSSNCHRDHSENSSRIFFRIFSSDIPSFYFRISSNALKVIFAEKYTKVKSRIEEISYLIGII